MNDNIGKYCVYDGVIKKAQGFEIEDEANKKAVYEVIRVIDGIPLFLDDHFSRMLHSIDTVGEYTAVTKHEFKEFMKMVLEANKCSNCNIKAVLYEKDGMRRSLFYINESYYPADAEVRSGVPVGLLRLVRPDPNVKLLNSAYKAAVNSRIREGGFFEVLLVNRDEKITEGSKSNVFFVRDGAIYTAPGTAVLKGVTRKHVLEACRKAGFKTVEAFTGTDELHRVEGIFLSGTSIKVLPVSSIDGLEFRSPALQAVLSVKDEFDRMVKKYIEENVNIW